MAVKHETIDSLITKLNKFREKHGGETAVVIPGPGQWVYGISVEERRLSADGYKFVSRQGRPCITICG